MCLDFITRTELVTALRLSRDTMDEKEISTKSNIYSSDRLFSDKDIIEIATEIQGRIDRLDDDEETKLTEASIAKMNNDIDLKTEKNENKMTDKEREADAIRKRLISEAFKYVFEYENIEDMIDSIIAKSNSDEKDEKESKEQEQEQEPKRLAVLDKAAKVMTFVWAKSESADKKTKEMAMDKARRAMDAVDGAVTSDQTLAEFEMRNVSFEEFSLIEHYIDEMQDGSSQADYEAYCDRIMNEVGFGNLCWCASYLGMKKFESYLAKALSYYIWGNKMKLTIPKKTSKHNSELINYSVFAESINEYNKLRKQLLNFALYSIKAEHYYRDSLLLGACSNLAKELDNDLRLFLKPSIVEELNFKGNEWKQFPVRRFGKGKKHSLVLLKLDVTYVAGLQTALLNAFLESGILHGYIRIKSLEIEKNNSACISILVEVTDSDMKSLEDVLRTAFKKTSIGVVSNDAMGWREVCCGPRFNLCILPPNVEEEDHKSFDNSSLMLCSDDHEVHISDWLKYPLIMNNTEISDSITIKTSNSVYDSLISSFDKIKLQNEPR